MIRYDINFDKMQSMSSRSCNFWILQTCWFQFSFRNLLSVLCFLNLKVIFLTSTKFCHDFYWVKDRSTFFRVYVGKKEAKGGKSLIKETNPLFIQVDTTCSGHNQLSNFFFMYRKSEKLWHSPRVASMGMSRIFSSVSSSA